MNGSTSIRLGSAGSHSQAIPASQSVFFLSRADKTGRRELEDGAVAYQRLSRVQ